MDRQSRGFTGWHATFALVAFFGVVMAVNFTMAALARSSFGGVVVENSYVASQEFNGWLAEARESGRIGWQASTTRRPDGHLAVALAGAPANATMAGVARHPLGRAGDIPLSFAADGAGRFVSAQALPPGRWTLRLEARAGAALWRSEEDIR
jgi:nitrogen fixation protein FixH